MNGVDNLKQLNIFQSFYLQIFDIIDYLLGEGSGHCL